MNNNYKAPQLWGWPTYLSIAVAIVILVFAANMVDLKEIWREIGNCDKRFVLLGALAHYATYLIRGMRWRRCLIHLPVKAGNVKFSLLVFFYNFVDNLVPAKLGDVYAAHLARINCKIRRSAAFGSIVFLRMVDAWIILLLAAVASWVLFADRLPGTVLWSLIGGGIIAAGATFIMLVFFLFKKRLPAWLPNKLQQMIQSFQTGMWPSPKELFPIAVLTIIIWTLETVWILSLTLAFDLHIGSAEAVFLTMIPLLASAFPLTPSGAGVVEITLFSCLRVLGISSPVAGSLTVVNRFIDYWLHIALGVLTWAVRRVIGLRTWRDVPLADLKENGSADMAIAREISG
ncbi:MAG: flippase-like domain-containing protein [Desulfobacterales bacterium]|nr:MAG: flippase-like domain-containing protein [Desulfobacterales bacterium]